MTAQVQSAEVLAVVKSIIKERGMTYRDLADAIGMSESGLKKLLAADDCSLARLADVCQTLGVNLEEVLYVARTGNRKPFTFTEHQTRFFLSHPDRLWFMWAIEEADGHIEATAKNLGIDESLAKKFLGELEDLGLLQQTTAGTVKRRTPGDSDLKLRPVLGPPVMNPLQDTLLQAARDGIGGDVVDRDQLDLSFARLKLRPATVGELKHALRDLLREFGIRSRRERVTHPSASLVSIGAMTVLAPFELGSVFRKANAR